MDLFTLARSHCPDGIDCPRISMSITGTAVVQGERTDSPNAVEIPSTLVTEALHAFKATHGVPMPTAAPHLAAVSGVEVTAAGTLIVRGGQLPADDLAAMRMPEHENAVEVPFSVLKEANNAHRAAAC